MALSEKANNVNWLMANFVRSTPGVEQAVAVSSDGLLIALSSQLERGSADKMAAIKNFPTQPSAGNPTPGPRNLQGNWRNDGDYYLNFAGEEERKAHITNGKLSFKTEGVTVVLVPES